MNRSHPYIECKLKVLHWSKENQTEATKEDRERKRTKEKEKERNAERVKGMRQHHYSHSFDQTGRQIRHFSLSFMLPF